jgi:long-chain fatty acid transport protein
MKKQLWVIFQVLTLIFGFTNISGATNGMRLIGIGPIQRSMGGANVGLPKDSTAAITNPAGLIKLERRLDVAFTAFDPSVEYEATSSFGQVTTNGKKIKSKAQPFPVPGLGVILPINEEWTFGFGGYGLSGMGVDYASNLYNNRTFTEYSFLKLAPGFSYKVNERLAVGFAPNINYAEMNFEAGSPAEVPHRDGKAWGIGATFGILYDISEKVSFGFAYETKQVFQDFEFDTVSGRDELSFDQPQSLTAGLGIKSTERLRFAADVQWIDWEQIMGVNKPSYKVNNSGASPYNMRWSDQFVYKFGAEYDLNDKWQLRAGYNYGEEPTEATQPFEVIAFPGIAEHHFTAGFGYQINQDLELNVGFMYAPTVDKIASNASGQFLDTSKSSMSQYSVDVGLSWKF